MGTQQASDRRRRIARASPGEDGPARRRALERAFLDGRRPGDRMVAIAAPADMNATPARGRRLRVNRELTTASQREYAI